MNPRPRLIPREHAESYVGSAVDPELSDPSSSEEDYEDFRWLDQDDPFGI